MPSIVDCCFYFKAKITSMFEQLESHWVTSQPNQQTEKESQPPCCYNNTTFNCCCVDAGTICVLFDAVQLYYAAVLIRRITGLDGPSVCLSRTSPWVENKGVKKTKFARTFSMAVCQFWDQNVTTHRSGWGSGSKLRRSWRTARKYVGTWPTYFL